MNIFTSIRNEIIKAAQQTAFQYGIPLHSLKEARMHIVPAPHSEADMATNAALILATSSGLSSLMLAGELMRLLAPHPSLAACTLAEPGFINIRLADRVLARTLEANLRQENNADLCFKGEEDGKADALERLPLSFKASFAKGPQGEASLHNPLFAILYAYARISSVKRYIARSFPSLDFSTTALIHAIPMAFERKDKRFIIQLLAQFPYQRERAAMTLEPYYIALYLNTVAKAFHQFWQRGEENAEMRFAHRQNTALTQANAAILQGVANVIAAGLRTFKITPSEEMRG